MKCLNCGGRLSKENKVCEYCGSYNPDFKENINYSTPVETYSTSTFEAKNHSKVKIFVAVIIIFIIFLGIGLGVGLSGLDDDSYKNYKKIDSYYSEIESPKITDIEKTSSGYNLTITAVIVNTTKNTINSSEVTFSIRSEDGFFLGIVTADITNVQPGVQITVTAKREILLTFDRPATVEIFMITTK